MRPQNQSASAPSGDGLGQPRVNFRQADAFYHLMEIPLVNGGVALIDDDAAAQHYFGDFACLNFPTPCTSY